MLATMVDADGSVSPRHRSMNPLRIIVALELARPDEREARSPHVLVNPELALGEAERAGIRRLSVDPGPAGRVPRHAGVGYAACDRRAPKSSGDRRTGCSRACCSMRWITSTAFSTRCAWPICASSPSPASFRALRPGWNNVETSHDAMPWRSAARSRTACWRRRCCTPPSTAGAGERWLNAARERPRPATARRLFPQGGDSLLAWLDDWADRRMVEAVGGLDL